LAFFLSSTINAYQLIPQFPGVVTASIPENYVTANYFYSDITQNNDLFILNGKLGIGITNPDYPLEILNSTGPQFAITHTDGIDYFTGEVNSAGNLILNPSGGNMYFNSSTLRNLGNLILDEGKKIYVATDNAQLEIGSSSFSSYILLMGDRKTGSSQGGNLILTSKFDPGVPSKGSVVFRAYDGDNATVNATILRTGEFGIGETAPTAFLDIKGSETNRASFRIRNGVAPLAPEIGDIWTQASGNGQLWFRKNGTTSIDLANQAQNVVNIISGNEFPAAVGGIITLEANTKYVLANANLPAVVLNDVLRCSSNTTLEGLTIITNKGIEITGGVTLEDCIIIHNGTGAYRDAIFSTSLSPTVVASIKTCILQTTMPDGRAGHFSAPFFGLFAAIDTVAQSKHGFVFDKAGPKLNAVLLTGFDDGHKFIDSPLISIQVCGTQQGTNTANCVHYSFHGNIGATAIGLGNVSPSTNEYAFYFSPTGNYSGVTMIGNPNVGVADNTFAPGSLDQSYPVFKFSANSNIPDSEVAAYINALGQGGVTTLLDQSKASRMVATYNALLAERFSVSENGTIRYNGTENTIIQTIAAITGTVSSGTNITLNFYFARGNYYNTITDFVDAGGGQVTVNTSLAHGYQNGDRIIIEDTSNYKGEYTISNVTETAFEITQVFVSSGTGNHYKLQPFSKATNDFSGANIGTSLVAQFRIKEDDVGFLCVENIDSTAEWETEQIQLSIK